MDVWTTWFVFAGLVLVLESMTRTLYLGMVTFGLGMGGFISLFIDSPALQTLGALAAWFLATSLLSKAKMKKMRRQRLTQMAAESNAAALAAREMRRKAR